MLATVHLFVAFPCPPSASIRFSSTRGKNARVFFSLFKGNGRVGPLPSFARILSPVSATKPPFPYLAGGIAAGTYLGRAWKAFFRFVFIFSFLLFSLVVSRLSFAWEKYSALRHPPIRLQVDIILHSAPNPRFSFTRSVFELSRHAFLRSASPVLASVKGFGGWE